MKLPIEQADIDQHVPRDPERCAVKAALRRRFKGCEKVIVGFASANVDGALYRFSPELRDFLLGLEHGKPSTRFMQAGDRIQIEMLGPDGVSLFGRIDQQVVAP